MCTWTVWRDRVSMASASSGSKRRVRSRLIVTAKNGISSVELGRRLGVKQPTAWAVKHKIMAVMARREGETRLAGRVEMRD